MIRKNLFPTVMLLAVADMACGADNPKSEMLVRMFDSGSVSAATRLRAELIATDILASAGVRLRWANLRSTPDSESRSGGCGISGAAQTIDVRFLYSTPEDHKPGALAEAFPFAQNGVRIVVFYDRVARLTPQDPRMAGWLLGHVLAHETGHILLRNDSHAETGLMKARWTEDDYTWMGFKNLSLTPADSSSIRSNLTRVCSPVADNLMAADNH